MLPPGPSSIWPPQQAIVDVMVNLQFPLVETLWKTFWRYNLSQPSERRRWLCECPGGRKEEVGHLRV